VGLIRAWDGNCWVGFILLHWGIILEDEDSTRLRWQKVSEISKPQCRRCV